MDYMKVAFGIIDWNADKHAAVKFAVGLTFMAHRLYDLCELVKENSIVTSICGDPGWVIERLDEENAESNINRLPGWNDTQFWVEVDELEFSMAFSNCYLTQVEFFKYVSQAVEAYVGMDRDREKLPEIIFLREMCR